MKNWLLPIIVIVVSVNLSSVLQAEAIGTISLGNKTASVVDAVGYMDGGDVVIKLYATQLSSEERKKESLTWSQPPLQIGYLNLLLKPGVSSLEISALRGIDLHISAGPVNPILDNGPSTGASNQVLSELPSLVSKLSGQLLPRAPITIETSGSMKGMHEVLAWKLLIKTELKEK